MTFIKKKVTGFLAPISYTSGSWIDVQVEITANHDGYFTFKLCPTDDWENDSGQECFDQ